ncbi:MAG: 3-methylornithine--L-lysine ligase PylC, partial [Proteobacteria bacterium]|nr:3-methylornithine--L-lysine ligase PylC [Pseudomonadota bacterium]
MIIGGGLQGVEAFYLAHKAGWQATLVDKNADCPASGMCDLFIHTDVTQGEGVPLSSRDIDLMIPTLEDDTALAAVEYWARDHSVPFAFDAGAYAISSSKARSGKLFSRLGIPSPAPWPRAMYPLIAKPSRGSGSKGVRLFASPGDMDDTILSSVAVEMLVMEEYVQGPQYSLEIVGHLGHYRPLQVTELVMDEAFDCKCVVAPAGLSRIFVDQFSEIAKRIATSLPLKGIMDVEVILSEGIMKVIEIDARLPSQTPTAVYWSSGRNMLCLLRDIFLSDTLPDNDTLPDTRGAVYQHIHVRQGVLEVAGEHLMSHVGPLHIRRDFFGADEAITNYRK